MTWEEAAGARRGYAGTVDTPAGHQELQCQVITHHPLSLEEIWDGVDISDEALEKTKKPPFPMPIKTNHGWFAVNRRA
jgi:hypothetical protein